ncbi:EEP domain-containing protein [Exilibacterium tricleocarpae]|uniref:EEP domain-containing protein n=1 Tax=Exilibacterium tricleocarpae TaxID=2591008 RepID=A0A545TLI2_9GAMM|nr:endonuclease/exonuclease/phosphatase family protein [Exilibacterium tricleocarpae]TQV78077.1 EEP domain-containing protein [Exilibacterium tricleocarpae]
MPDLNVLSYNIHKGFNANNTAFLLHEIRDAIRAQGAELVLLQEVIGEHQKHENRLEQWPRASQFEFLADQIWPHFAYGKNAIYQHGHHGNAILSKYPFDSWNNVNITRWRFSQRGLLHGRILERIHVICVHFGLLAAERRYQLRRLMHLIERGVPADAPLIIAGDFNDWTRQLDRRLQRSLGMQEVFQCLLGANARTFPSKWPLLAMDRIYFRGLRLLEGERLLGHPWRDLSDHCALQASFRLAD